MAMRLPAALLAAAVLVAGIAVVDHRNESGRGNHAELLEWYCSHDGTHCGGPSSASIERHWNERELAYEIVFVALVTAAATVALYRLDRRWRRA